MSEPYEYTIPNSHNSVNIITLTQPILQKGRFLGIVTIDISLDSLTQVLKTDIKDSSINLISPRGIETYSDMTAHIMQSKASFSDSAVITAINQVQQNKKQHRLHGKIHQDYSVHILFLQTLLILLKSHGLYKSIFQ